ncbi:flagellar protein FlaG [Denitromonas iodatirespirans]|uniref:Flagellar protein FlaG n=1 Tax=Denitromonas iodatirespirans TaxID=2795389 RepID=A0A944DC04_DENI1|nr:flagellar protein FlaG [Denitromonas iodatirespirans]MBT0961723.1 flagellar protein FlaG [Denitromonas iodatirespirans]
MSIPSVTSSAVQFVSPQATSAGRSGPAAGTEASAPPQAVKAAETEAAAREANAKAAAELDPAKLQEAVEKAQASLQAIARDITFSLNEKSGTVVIKVIERESKEVIRQIPSEEFLKIAEMLNDNIADIRAGLLVAQKA